MECGRACDLLDSLYFQQLRQVPSRLKAREPIVSIYCFHLTMQLELKCRELLGLR